MATCAGAARCQPSGRVRIPPPLPNYPSPGALACAAHFFSEASGLVPPAPLPVPTAACVASVSPPPALPSDATAAESWARSTAQPAAAAAVILRRAIRANAAGSVSCESASYWRLVIGFIFSKLFI